MAEPGWTFSEKSFYLAEFRGRSLALVAPEPLPADEVETLLALLDEFSKNDTRIVVLSPHRACVEALVGRVGVAEGADWVGALWRRLQAERRAGLALDPDRFADTEGWGFEDFKEGDPHQRSVTDMREQCLSCHETQRASDFVYSASRQ